MHSLHLFERLLLALVPGATHAVASYSQSEGAAVLVQVRLLLPPASADAHVAVARLAGANGEERGSGYEGSGYEGSGYEGGLDNAADDASGDEGSGSIGSGQSLSDLGSAAGDAIKGGSSAAWASAADATAPAGANPGSGHDVASGAAGDATWPVSFTMVLAGSVADFLHPERIAVSLATMLDGVSADDIILSMGGGSVVVDATVVCASLFVAIDAQAALRMLTLTQLSAALDVPVMSLGSASLVTPIERVWSSLELTLVTVSAANEAVAAPSPPPPALPWPLPQVSALLPPPSALPPQRPPPQPHRFTGDGSLTTIVAAAAAAAAALGVFAGGALIIRRRRLAHRAASGLTPSALEATPSTTSRSTEEVSEGTAAGALQMGASGPLAPSGASLAEHDKLALSREETQGDLAPRSTSRRIELAFGKADVGKRVRISGMSVVVGGTSRTVAWGTCTPPQVSGIIQSVAEVELGAITLRDGTTFPNCRRRSLMRKNSGPGRLRRDSTSAAGGNRPATGNQTKTKLALKRKLKHIRSTVSASEEAATMPAPAVLPRPPDEIMERALPPPSQLPRPSEATLSRLHARRASLQAGGEGTGAPETPPAEEGRASRASAMFADYSKSGELDYGVLDRLSRPPKLLRGGIQGSLRRMCSSKGVCSSVKLGGTDCAGASATVTQDGASAAVPQGAVPPPLAMSRALSQKLGLSRRPNAAQAKMAAIRARRLEETPPLPPPAPLPPPSSQVAAARFRERSQLRQLGPSERLRRAVCRVANAQTEGEYRSRIGRGTAEGLQRPQRTRESDELRMRACVVQSPPPAC